MKRRVVVVPPAPSKDPVQPQPWRAPPQRTRPPLTVSLGEVLQAARSQPRKGP